MKKTLLLCLLSVIFIQLAAQPCAHSTAKIDLHANNISTVLNLGGSLFNDSNNAFFKYLPSPSGAGPSTIYAANVWIGGLDAAQNKYLSARDYGSGFNAPAGPLNAAGETDSLACIHWDRIFKAEGNTIKNFLDDLPSFVNDPGTASTLYPEVMGWPGKGNPYFADIRGFDLPDQDLAPFFDSDQDGLYNPLAGDYPAVQLKDKQAFVPAEMLWCVWNSQYAGSTSAFQFEEQQTVWAFNCSNQPVLKNTIFTSHKIINKSSITLDSFFMDMWSDIDLGCNEDDYIGSNPALNCYFAYNQDVVDGLIGNTCDGVSTFSGIPPVQSVTFLNRPMDKFMYYTQSGSLGSGTSDPSSSAEYYNYLTGSWRDGTPLSAGGTGYNPGTNNPPANFAFPDAPSNPNAWSMCSSNIPSIDIRGLGINKIGTFQPGQVEELTVAWTVHPDPVLPCGLGSAFGEIALVHSLFDESFGTVCSPLTAAPEPLHIGFALFPNPASQSLTIRYDDLTIQEIRIFSADGRLIRVVQNVPTKDVTLDVSGLTAGLYEVQVLTSAGSVVQKLVVSR